MKKTSKTIIFFGNERLATGVTTSAPTLQSLVDAGYNVAAVVSNYERGTSRSARELEIATIAKKHDIPVLLPKDLSDIQEQLLSYRAEAGILVAYGKMVPQAIIDLFPRGIVNIHPSLLPIHRGPTPIESVILEDAKETGVSIMSLVKSMDAGPIYGQAELPLTGTESKQSLADQLQEIGASMLLELLPEILTGQNVALPQDNSRATYDALISKDAGIIDWHKPAAQLEREVRAFYEWPKSHTTIAGKEIVVMKAHTIEQTGNPGTITVKEKQLIAFCGKDALVIEKLKPAGKKEMTATAFLAGYGHTLSR